MNDKIRDWTQKMLKKANEAEAAKSDADSQRLLTILEKTGVKLARLGQRILKNYGIEAPIVLSWEWEHDDGYLVSRGVCTSANHRFLFHQTYSESRTRVSVQKIVNGRIVAEHYGGEIQNFPILEEYKFALAKMIEAVEQPWSLKTRAKRDKKAVEVFIDMPILNPLAALDPNEEDMTWEEGENSA